MKTKEERIDPQIAIKAIWLKDYANLTKLKAYTLAREWGVPISVLESSHPHPHFKWYYLLPLLLIPLLLIPLLYPQSSVEVPVKVDPVELKISWHVEDGKFKVTEIE